MPPSNPGPLPLTLCWHCDRPLDDAASVDDSMLKPGPGAVSLCMYCGAVAIFGEDMRLIKPTKDLLDELWKDRDFGRAFIRFQWARQYLMVETALLGYEAEHEESE